MELQPGMGHYTAIPPEVRLLPQLYAPSTGTGWGCSKADTPQGVAQPRVCCRQVLQRILACLPDLNAVQLQRVSRCGTTDWRATLHELLARGEILCMKTLTCRCVVGHRKFRDALQVDKVSFALTQRFLKLFCAGTPYCVPTALCRL